MAMMANDTDYHVLAAGGDEVNTQATGGEGEEASAGNTQATPIVLPVRQTNVQKYTLCLC